MVPFARSAQGAGDENTQLDKAGQTILQLLGKLDDRMVRLDRGVLDALGLAPHERIAGFIHIGRPPGPPEDRPRPPLNEITVRFTA